MEFSEDQLDVLMKAMPDMVGFSGYGGDGAVLLLALEQLSTDDRVLMETVMTQGSPLKAAVHIGGKDIAKSAEVRGRITVVLKDLRGKFEAITNQLYY